MAFEPIARILMRYGIGYFAGSKAGNALALDPDAVFVLSLVLGALVEWAYARAKRTGGAL